MEVREAEARARLEHLRAEDQTRLEAERELQGRVAALRTTVSAAEGELRAEQALLQSNGQNLARLADQRTAGERRLADLAAERTALDAELHALQSSHAALLEQIDELRRQIAPSEAEQAQLEQAQGDLERREAELTSALLAAESAHSRAAVEVQRARDRLDTLWERAAGDDIDIEQAVADDGQPTTDDGQPTTDDGQPTTDQNLQATSPRIQPSGDAGMLKGSEASQDAELKTENLPAETLEARIQALKIRIQRLGVVNPLALEEYEQESERHAFLTNQSADLRQAEAALRELIVELDSAMQMRFEATFRAVAAEFEHSFTRLFGGGQAQLLLTRPNGNSNGDGGHETVEGLGVEIVARPPGKRQQTLSLLSGGERTLTASALLFAILKVNPSPFCVLDEVDAALDEANVGRFREALADLSEQTQFLLVTHNRGTIEAADTIYGVSMGEDSASRVLSLRLEELVEEG